MSTMALAGGAAFVVAMLMVTLALNMLLGWDLDASCPGTTQFCDGVYWTYVAGNLPTWLFIVQILAVLALASPFALARVGR